MEHLCFVCTYLRCTGLALCSLCWSLMPVYWGIKHVLSALPAPVPPPALGRLQVNPHRLRVLLHLQHHGLPHRLWNPVPAGELQLQDGPHARYGSSSKPLFDTLRVYNHLWMWLFPNRDLDRVHPRAVQRLCRPSSRWAHALLPHVFKSQRGSSGSVAL